MQTSVMMLLWRFYQIQFRFNFVQGWWSFGWHFFPNIENRTVSWASPNSDDHFCNRPRSSWCWERLFDKHECYWCKHERAIHSKQTFSSRSYREILSPSSHNWNHQCVETIMSCCLSTIHNLSRQRKKKAARKWVDHSKQVLDKEIKEVKGKIDH